MAMRRACACSPNACPASRPRPKPAPKVADQLSTSVWGGNELSLEPQGSNTRLVYQVRIVVL